jgi:hypothetical protein
METSPFLWLYFAFNDLLSFVYAPQILGSKFKVQCSRINGIINFVIPTWISYQPSTNPNANSKANSKMAIVN